MKSKSIFVNILIFLVIPLVYFTIHYQTAKYWKEHSNKITNIKPFSLPLIKNYTAAQPRISHKEFAGKAFIMNFWASWCTTCDREEKAVVSLWKRYAETEKIKFLSVATMDNKNDVLKSTKRKDIQAPLALDGSGEMAQQYEVKSIPQTLLVDSQGRICHWAKGPLVAATLVQFESALKSLLHQNGKCL